MANKAGIAGLLTIAASIAGIASAAHEFGWFGSPPAVPSPAPVPPQPIHQYFHATVQMEAGYEHYVVKVHSAPFRIASTVGRLVHGASVEIVCTVQGDVVTTRDGRSSSLWDRISPDGYMADVYLNTGSDQPQMPLC